MSHAKAGFHNFKGVVFWDIISWRASWGAARLYSVACQSLKTRCYVIVYILKCADGKFYVGCTSDLNDRMKRHLAGEVISTQDRLPINLVTYITFAEKQKAFDFEKYLKTGSGRAVMFKRLV